MKTMSTRSTFAGLVAVGCLSTACGGKSTKYFGDNSPYETGAGGVEGTPQVGSGGIAGTPPGGVGGVIGMPPTTGVGGGGIGAGGSGGGSLGCIPGIPPTSQIPRLLNREYDATVEELLGIIGLAADGGKRPSALLVADDQGPFDATTWNAYLDVAESIAAQVMEGTDKSKFIDCDPSVSGCFEETIRSFGRRAFRRPVTDQEVASFMRITNVEPQGTPEEAAEGILIAFLASPSFLLLPELDTQKVDGAHFKLSSHEVATRLSILLWGSIPDAELNAAADAGELDTKEKILAQAQRMMADRKRSRFQVIAAHHAYAKLDESSSHWWRVPHDEATYTNWSEAAVPVLMAEMDAFFEEVVFSGGGFGDLFLSNVGFVNEATAALYGLAPEAYGSALSRVEFEPAQRPGMLTRIGFLSSFSHHDSTSPVTRGTFVSVSVLGLDPGAPPVGAFPMPLPNGEYLTQREWVEQLTAPPDCASCHTSYLNPPGFVLETYDAVGSWQNIDPLGGAIDGVATVRFGENDDRVVRSPLELMQGLAESDNAVRVYAQELVSFATKRSPNSSDYCVVEELGFKLSGDDYTLLELFVDLTQIESFQVRATED